MLQVRSLHGLARAIDRLNEAVGVSIAWLALFTVLVERRSGFVQALEERGIPTSVVHRRIDRHSVFGGIRRDLPGQDHFDQHQISLPLHSSLSDREVQQVLDAVRAGW